MTMVKAATSNLILGLVALLVFAGRAHADRPNVVLIMVDDASWECFGCYGGEDYQTPHIDNLAAKGVRFQHCYSTPICTRSRVMIMTGKYTFRNYTHFGYPNPKEKTFGNLMKSAGYKIAIAGKCPECLQQVLDEYDVLVFSDVESKNFQLAPQFFDRSKFGSQPLTFPDRVRLTVEAIQAGTHAMFLGGWLSFNGELGKGGWGRTGLKTVLPATCLDIEDLRESTEGFTGQTVAADHPTIAGVDLETMPPILGYNIVKPREGCDVIATWKGTDDPLLTVGQFGDGRVLAYTSDPAPHWGCNFVYWDGYQQFWSQALNWLLTGDQ